MPLTARGAASAVDLARSTLRFVLDSWMFGEEKEMKVKKSLALNSDYVQPLLFG